MKTPPRSQPRDSSQGSVDSNTSNGHVIKVRKKLKTRKGTDESVGSDSKAKTNHIMLATSSKTKAKKTAPSDEEDIPEIGKGPSTQSDVDLPNPNHCTTCGEVFLSSVEVLNHAILAHKYPCRQCRQRFSLRAALQEHLRTWHAPGLSAEGVNLDRQLAVKIERIYSRQSPKSAKICSCGFQWEKDEEDVWLSHVKECPNLCRFFPVKAEPVEFEPQPTEPEPWTMGVTEVKIEPISDGTEPRASKASKSKSAKRVPSKKPSKALSKGDIATVPITMHEMSDESDMEYIDDVDNDKDYHSGLTDDEAEKEKSSRKIVKTMTVIGPTGTEDIPNSEARKIGKTLVYDTEEELSTAEAENVVKTIVIGGIGSKNEYIARERKLKTMTEIRIESVDDLMSAIDGLLADQIPENSNKPDGDSKKVSSSKKVSATETEEMDVDTQGIKEEESELDGAPVTGDGEIESKDNIATLEVKEGTSKSQVTVIKVKTEPPDEVTETTGKSTVQDGTANKTGEKRKLAVAFKCASCSRLFEKRAECLDHARNCSMNICPSCGSKFSCELDVSKHTMICDGRLRCVRCRQRIGDSAAEKCHEKVMVNSLSECPVCDEQVSALSLGQHLDTIHGGIVDLYTCDICNVQVDRHVLLERHLLVHMQDRRWYACDLCKPSVLTTDKRTFNIHLLNFHLTPDRYACNCCTDDERDKTPRTREEWSSHFHSHHSRCPICRGKIEEELKEHLRSCCLPIYSEKAYFEKMTLERNCVVPSYRRATPTKNKSDLTCVPHEPKKEVEDEEEEKTVEVVTATARAETPSECSIDDVSGCETPQPLDDSLEDPRPSRNSPSRGTEIVTKMKKQDLSAMTINKVGFTDLKLEGDMSSIPTSAFVGNFQLILTKLVNELPSMAKHLKESRKCSYCQVEFPTNFLFAVHLLMMHSCFLEEDCQFKPYRSISMPIVSSRLIVQGRYRCTVCNTVQVNVPVAHLLRHAQECGQCPGCSLKFPSVELLKLHVEESICGPGRRKFVLFPKLECRICDRVFTFMDSFDAHLETHVVGMTTCAICHYSFENKQKCLQHISEHTDYKPYCFTCERYCATFWEYHQHTEGKDPEHEAKKVAKCPHCEFGTCKEAELRRHLSVNHLCTICGIVVKSKSALTHHRKTACVPRDDLNVRPLPHYVESSQVDELRWLRRLGRDVVENSDCDVCGRFFLSTTFLQAHTRFVHPSNVQCSVCVFLEPYRETKRRHEVAIHAVNLPESAIQTGMVWFRCSFCTSSFTSDFARFAHEKVKHKIVCSFCQGTFADLGDLRAHSTHDHEDAPYGCTKCFCAYDSPEKLVKHSKDHAKKYACIYCPALFATLALVSEHAATEHDFETRADKLASTQVKEEQQTSSLMCQHCGRVFPPNEIRQHEKGCLTDVKLVDLRCLHCAATFHSMDALQRHQSVHVLVDDSGTQTDPDITGIATMDALPNLSAFMMVDPNPRHPRVSDTPRVRKRPKTEIENEFDMDLGGQVANEMTFLHEVPKVPETVPQDFVSDDDASAKIKDGILSMPIDNSVRMIEYSCAECEADPKTESRFATLDLLNTHMDRVHNSVPEFDDNVAVRFDEPAMGHRCEFCGRNYLTENGLKKHIDTVHAKSLQIFDCTECPVSYTSREEIVDHMKLEHDNGSGEMECKICLWRFQSTQMLWKHWSQHHQ